MGRRGPSRCAGGLHRGGASGGRGGGGRGGAGGGRCGRQGPAPPGPGAGPVRPGPAGPARRARPRQGPGRTVPSWPSSPSWPPGRVRRAAQAPTSPSASSRPPTARRAGAAEDARARCHVRTTSVGGVAPSRLRPPASARRALRPGQAGAAAAGSARRPHVDPGRARARTPRLPAAAPPRARRQPRSPRRRPPHRGRRRRPPRDPPRRRRDDRPAPGRRPSARDRRGRSGRGAVVTTGAPGCPATRATVMRSGAQTVAFASPINTRTTPASATSAAAASAAAYGVRRRPSRVRGRPSRDLTAVPAPRVAVGGSEQRLDPVELSLQLPRAPRPDVRLEHEADAAAERRDGLDRAADDAHAGVPVPLDRGEHRVGPVG